MKINNFYVYIYISFRYIFHCNHTEQVFWLPSFTLMHSRLKLEKVHVRTEEADVLVS